MYFLYSLLFTLGIAVLLPRFLWDALTHGKYVEGLKERLGRLPSIDTRGRPVIWLHCVSVGETQAARPLVRAVLQRFPDHALVVSTITRTGQRVAREVFAHEAAAVFYFPFDWAWTVRRALGLINPQVVLIMETELWPRFLLEARRRQVRVALVNGRLSEKSFRRYSLLRRFIKRVVGCLDLAMMQSDADAERMLSLCLDQTRVEVSGNVKFDLEAHPNDRALTVAFRERFRFRETAPLIVAASTHQTEERILIKAFKLLRSTPEGAHARLLVAPRHPERFDEAASELASSGLSWARRSQEPAASDTDCDSILLDSIGELRAVYPLATLVFVGGSIRAAGGHNVLEPAAAGACVVTGAHTQNFKAVMDAFLEREALAQLPPLAEEEAPQELARVFNRLLADEGARLEMTARAQSVLDQNRGATMRTVERLAELLADVSASRATNNAQVSEGGSTPLKARMKV